MSKKKKTTRAWVVRGGDGELQDTLFTDYRKARQDLHRERYFWGDRKAVIVPVDVH